MRLFVKWLVCAVSLFLAARLFPGGFVLWGGWAAMIACATILWLLNIFLRPVLQVLALPFTLVTFGLFSLVVNGIVVALAAALIPGIVIRGLGVCVFISLLVSAGNLLFARRSHWRAD
ncbi:MULTISPECIES: phage holin family protein [Acutalibacteraceae]|uniref:phage holin family protein n=1 Tax=Acutalibacteraceae TaxID=3082771 RepID=UPI0013E8D33A|nr:MULTISPECIES: phage holin family protein [Acutalibacteraceae]